MLLFVLLPLAAQEKPDTVYTFRFVTDKDMFYVPFRRRQASCASPPTTPSAGRTAAPTWFILSTSTKAPISSALWGRTNEQKTKQDIKCSLTYWKKKG